MKKLCVCFSITLLYFSCISQCANVQFDGDCDNDGVLNIDDLDSDNDGITDVVECPNSTVENYLSGLTLISGSNTSNLVPGNKLLKTNCVQYLGVSYDVVISIISTSLSGANLALNASGDIVIQNGTANLNPYFTYNITIVAPGSATISTPNGTAVTVNNIIIGLWDIDGAGLTVNVGDVVGYSNSLSIYSTISGSGINNLGFNSGSPLSYSFKRPILIPGLPQSSTDVNYSVRLLFNQFSTGNFIFGFTGTNSNLSPNRGINVSIRSINACDTDYDGFTDQVDLDSDNDNCFDVLEAYSNLTIDLDNNGLFGNTSPIVSTFGLVNTSTYPGTNSWVTSIGGPTCSIALPVDLINFNIEKGFDNQALITWETEYINNCDRFDLQKSYNGINWETKISLQQNNTSPDTVQFYSFDDFLEEQENYYRIIQYSVDNKPTFYEPKVIKYNCKTDFDIYPNPSNGLINLESNKFIEEISIYSLDNTLIEQFSFETKSKSQKISLTNLNSGAYFLKICNKFYKIILL